MSTIKVLLFFSLCIFFFDVQGQSQVEMIDESVHQSAIKARIGFLASDELKGRKTGSEEINIAARYIASSLIEYGVQIAPGMSSYMQPIAFATFEPPARASMDIGEQRFNFPRDFILLNGPKTRMTGTTVFVGHGSEAELEGKDLQFNIAVSLAGDGISQDPRDWIVQGISKRKRLEEKGAVALIEIYQSTQIPWQFLRSAGTQAQTTFDDGRESSDLPHAWLGTIDSTAIAILQGGEIPIHLSFDKVVREVNESSNVVGYIEGTDPDLKDEFIVYSAHYDHVGIGRADVQGDSIYNGARDNAVGSVAVLSLAEYFAKNPPKRSSLFVWFTAEEIGLLGSKYFVDNSPIDHKDIKYCFNIDNAGYNDTSLVSVIGLTRTSAESDIIEACAAFGLSAIEDPAKEQGLFDRSDNVNFARVGIPAPTFSLGFSSFDNQIFKYYHKPADHVESLDLNYIEKYVQSYILSASKIANAPEAHFWIEGDKYYNSGIQLYQEEE